MRKSTYIFLALVTLLWIGCSTAEIRQAQVLTQAEIDEHNKNYPVDEPDTPPTARSRPVSRTTMSA